MNGNSFKSEIRFYKPDRKYCKLGPGSYKYDNGNKDREKQPCFLFENGPKSRKQSLITPGPGYYEHTNCFDRTDGLSLYNSLTRVYKSMTPTVGQRRKAGSNPNPVQDLIKNQSRPHSTLSSRSNFSFQKNDSNHTQGSRENLDSAKPLTDPKLQIEKLDEQKLSYLPEKSNLIASNNFVDPTSINLKSYKRLQMVTRRVIKGHTSRTLHHTPNLSISDNQLKKRFDKIRKSFKDYVHDSDYNPGPANYSVNGNIYKKELNMKQDVDKIYDRIRMEYERKKLEKLSQLHFKETKATESPTKTLKSVATTENQLMNSIVKENTSPQTAKKKLAEVEESKSGYSPPNFKSTAFNNINLLHKVKVGRIEDSGALTEEDRLIINHANSLKLFFVHLNYRFDTEGYLNLNRPNLDHYVFTDYFNQYKYFRVKMEIISLKDPKSFELGFKHFEDQVTMNHSFDLGGRLFNCNALYKEKFDWSEGSTLELFYEEGIVEVFIDCIQVLKFKISIEHYVFFVKFSKIDNIIRIVECNIQLGFDYIAVDKNIGNLYHPGNNRFTYRCV